MWSQEKSMEECLPSASSTGEATHVVAEVMRSLADPSQPVLADWDDARRTRALVVLISICLAFFGLMLGLQGGVAQALLTALKLPLIWLGAAAISLPLLWLLSEPRAAEADPKSVTVPVLQALASGSLAICCLGPILPVVWLTLTEFNGGTLDASWFAYRRVFLAGLVVALVGVVLVARSLLQRFQWPAVFAFGCTTGLAGLQLAWLLRPIVGAPGSGVVLFREVESNGLAQVLQALAAVLL